MTILIENLTFETIIGILDIERISLQKVSIDCIIHYCYHDGAFINYAQVSALIEETMHTQKFELIETALETLSVVLQKSFPLIDELTLTIRKPNILQNCTVGVRNHFIFIR
jgi:dihydroneopterin aldolase